MRNSMLTINDVGTIVHDRTIAAGEEQSISFKDNDSPPIFDPGAPKYDVIIEGQSVTRNYNKGELREKLEEAGLNSDGKVDVL